MFALIGAMGARSKINPYQIPLRACQCVFLIVWILFIKAQLANSLGCRHFVEPTQQDSLISRLNLVISTPRLDLIPNSIEARKITYLIVERETGENIGVRLLHRASDGTNQTVGYIREGSENKGYAFEGLTSFLDVFFNQNPSEVVTALVPKTNYASARLMAKVGFSHGGVTGPYDRFSLARSQFSGNFTDLVYSTRPVQGPLQGLEITRVFPGFGVRYGNNLRDAADPFLNPPFVNLGVQRLRSFERKPGFRDVIEYVRNSETDQVYRRVPGKNWEPVSESDFAEISRSRGFFQSLD